MAGTAAATQIHELYFPLPEHEDFVWAQNLLTKPNKPYWLAQGAIFINAPCRPTWGALYLWLADCPDIHGATLHVELNTTGPTVYLLNKLTPEEYSSRLHVILKRHGWFPELTYHADKNAGRTEEEGRIPYVSTHLLTITAPRTPPTGSKRKLTPPAPPVPGHRTPRYHLRSTTDYVADEMKRMREAEGEGGAKE